MIKLERLRKLQRENKICKSCIVKIICEDDCNKYLKFAVRGIIRVVNRGTNTTQKDLVLRYGRTAFDLSMYTLRYIHYLYDKDLDVVIGTTFKPMNRPLQHYEIHSFLKKNILNRRRIFWNLSEKEKCGDILNVRE